jgi:aspartyl-tRNA(Asn)/glutamyl-tRNA(Gln) amidotransferase subunit A
MSPTPPDALAVAHAVRAGRETAASVVEAAIDRIEAAADLVAVVDFDPAPVRAEAAAVDARLAAGEDLPLAGVPVTIKDVIWVKGRRVTQGSRLFADFVAPADAVAVERLRRAGAVIVGMSNTSEFACKGLTTNRVYGTTRHPLDPRLTPGGSSGGPSTAVMAGLVPLALGTDAGGSSRRPPAHVGAVGFKPSFGAIPHAPGFAGPVPGIEVLAPIARTVADAAAMFAVLRGPDPRDPDSLLAPEPPHPTAAPRIAYTRRFGMTVPVEPAIEAGIERAVEGLRAAGFVVEERDPPWPAGVDEATLMPLQHAGLAALHGDAFRRDPDVFDPDIAVQIERGLSLDAATVARARILAREVALALAGFFTRVDLLVGPTVPCLAWAADRLGPETIAGIAVPPRAHAAFTPLFNHAGVPALSLPVGRGEGGLPFGLQMVAARGADDLLLATAARAEALFAEKGLWP